MAKQSVGLVERHLEKGVLALAGLVLLAAVAQFVISSPNKIELSGGETVTPGTIDDKILEQADRVRTTILAAKPDDPEVLDPTPEFLNKLDPIADAGIDVKLPRSVAFLPEVPIIADFVAVVVELQPPLPLPKPVLTAGRSRLAVEALSEWAPRMEDDVFPPAELDYSEPVNWVTISAVWDRAAQISANEKYGKGRQFALLGGVEVQRRALRPDGSWREEDWQTITPYLRAKLPPIGEVAVVQARDGTPSATLEGMQTARQLYELINDPIVQLNMLRPIVQLPANGDPWAFPKIDGMDIIAQDDEFFNAEVPLDYKANISNLVNRYQQFEGSREVTAQSVFNDLMKTNRNPTDEEIAKYWKDLLRLAEEEYFKGLAARDEFVVNSANNVAVHVANKTFDDSIRTIATRLVEKFKENPLPRGPRIPVGPQSGEPVYVAHLQSPVQQVWVIDGNVGSVAGGQTYQYRIRPLLFNPFFGQPKSLKNPDESKAAFLRGEWSPASEPLTIVPETQYYARSATKESKEVTFELFRWYEGLWVKHSVRAGFGDHIGGELRTQLAEEGRTLVTFNADAFVLNVDNNRPFCGWNRVGRDGVRYGDPSPTTAVVLSDAKGNISERLPDLDRKKPRYSDVQKQVFVYKPPSKEDRSTLIPTGGGRNPGSAYGPTSEQEMIENRGRGNTPEGERRPRPSPRP